jgi:hypothetical protein
MVRDPKWPLPEIDPEKLPPMPMTGWTGKPSIESSVWTSKGYFPPGVPVQQHAPPHERTPRR